jgi:hypothetical protein
MEHVTHHVIAHGSHDRERFLLNIRPRRARKVYHPWAVENVPGVGGHLKVYHRR